MKKVWSLFLALVLAASMLSACGASPSSTDDAPSGETREELTFGYLAYSLSNVWNQYSCEAFQWKARQDGVNVVVQDCQGDPEKQISQAQDLISRGVDAISLYPCTPESGATVTRMCNEAGIPVAVENVFLPEDGSAGEVVGQVACQYNDIGYAAVEYAAKTWPGCKLLYVHGAPGGGVYESYQVGVDEALEDYKDSIEMVGLINGGWDTETSYNVVTDFVNAHTADFDVVFANDDQTAVGVYNALKEFGMENIPILSTGGSAQGYEMVVNGQEAANMTAPVNIQAIIVYDFCWAAANGETVENDHVPLPVIPVSQDNIEDWISWDDHAAAQAYIDANY